MKVALAAFSPQEISLVLIFKGLLRSQGHSAAVKIKSLKNLNDSIGNRFSDFSACCVISQLVPAYPLVHWKHLKIHILCTLLYFSQSPTLNIFHSRHVSFDSNIKDSYGNCLTVSVCVATK